MSGRLLAEQIATREIQRASAQVTIVREVTIYPVFRALRGDYPVPPRKGG